MPIDKAKKNFVTFHKINANFPKVRFTYIKLTRDFRKTRAMEILRRKAEAAYPFGKTIERHSEVIKKW